MLSQNKTIRSPCHAGNIWVLPHQAACNGESQSTGLPPSTESHNQVK